MKTSDLRWLAILAGAALAGCSAAPAEYRSDLELNDRPGLFTGPTGKFTLHAYDSSRAAPASEYEEFQRWRGSRDAAEQREFEDWRAWREWKKRQGQ